MQAKQRVPARRRRQLAASPACHERGTRFTVVQDASQGDLGLRTTGNPENVGLMPVHDQIAVSADGAAIHFDVQGSGAPALTFVHGWCCDRTYWDAQATACAPRHTIVCVDLAGHGASGRARSRWSTGAFGEDVAAVVRQLGLAQVVLIGHSMGGPVIVEAARRLPEAVIGVIGVDTWSYVSKVRSQQEVAQVVAPFRADFATAMDNFVRRFFPAGADPALVERVVAGMSAASPDIAIGAMTELRGHDRQLRQRLRGLRVPKIAITAGPSLSDATARDFGIDLMPMSGVGHFLMMEDPEGFNRLLAQAVQKCVAASAN
jgi:pimeloyl-ACP methyl ester carboxylesterase